MPPRAVASLAPVGAAGSLAPAGAAVSENEVGFKEGDTVKYLKDTRQDRLWTIDGIDDDDIIISTEDFKEGEEGWQIVVKEDIVRESGGLKIGESVDFKPDTLPKNIVEEIPLANLQEKQRLAQKEEQQESAPTLTKISETDKEKQDQEGDTSEDKKQLTI